MVALPGRDPELKSTSLASLPSQRGHVVLIPRPTNVISFPGGIKLEAPKQSNPRNLWDSLPIPSFTDVPAKPAECPVAEASLHMSTLCNPCNGPILLIWGRRTWTGLQTLHICACGLEEDWKVHCCPSHVRGNWSCDSVAWICWKKQLLSPGQHGSLRELWSSYLRRGRCWAQLPGCFILDSPWSSTVSHRAFYQPHQAFKSTLGRAYNAHLVKLLDSFSSFLVYPPRNVYCLRVTTICWGPQLVFFHSTGFINLTHRLNSLIEFCRVWPWRMSTPNMFVFVSILSRLSH